MHIENVIFLLLQFKLYIFFCKYAKSGGKCLFEVFNLVILLYICPEQSEGDHLYIIIPKLINNFFPSLFQNICLIRSYPLKKLSMTNFWSIFGHWQPFYFSIKRTIFKLEPVFKIFAHFKPPCFLKTLIGYLFRKTNIAKATDNIKISLNKSRIFFFLNFCKDLTLWSSTILKIWWSYT